MLRRLRVEGYRSLARLEVELGPLTVVTGPNGCGKTNLYRCLFLLAQAARGRLTATLAEEGGMPSALWAGAPLMRGRKQAPRRLTLEVESDQLGYSLACGLPVPRSSAFVLDPQVKEEALWLGRRRPSTTLLERGDTTVWLRDDTDERVEYPLQLARGESVLSQIIEPQRFVEVADWQRELTGWRFYHELPSQASAAQRQPRTSIFTPALADDGADLAGALQTILEVGDGDRLHACVDRAFPGWALAIADHDQARLEVTLRPPGLRRALGARELSDGTLRYLALTAALLTPRPPTLLALNEPETSLNPDLLEPLAALIADAARASQLWVTTHAEPLARALAQLTETQRLDLALDERGATQLARSVR